MTHHYEPRPLEHVIGESDYSLQQGAQDTAFLDAHSLVVHKSGTNFGQSLDTPTLPFLHNFECDFVWMDIVNLTAKFKVRSFTRS